MANRRLFQFRYSYERDIVDVYATVSIGAAGAPTLSNAKGVKSVVRNSAGDYTINLQDSFNLLLEARSIIKNATGIPSVLTGIKTDAVSSSTAPLVRLVTSAAGVATDPAVGDVLLLKISCRNAST